MKLLNGYGTVTKLSGRRRKPYAARITTGWTEDGKQIKKYLGYYKTRQDAMKVLADYNENPFDLATHEVTFAELHEKWLIYRLERRRIQKFFSPAQYDYSQAPHSGRYRPRNYRH